MISAFTLNHWVSAAVNRQRAKQRLLILLVSYNMLYDSATALKNRFYTQCNSEQQQSGITTHSSFEQLSQVYVFVYTAFVKLRYFVPGHNKPLYVKSAAVGQGWTYRPDKQLDNHKLWFICVCTAETELISKQANHANGKPNYS